MHTILCMLLFASIVLAAPVIESTKSSPNLLSLLSGSNHPSHPLLDNHNEHSNKGKEAQELNLFPTQPVKKAKYFSIKSSNYSKSSKDWLSLNQIDAQSSNTDVGTSTSGAKIQKDSIYTKRIKGKLRKDAFLNEYERLNLGHHMKARDLALKVRGIKIEGKIPLWASTWVRKRLIERGASNEYIADFRQRTKEITSKITGVKRYNPNFAPGKGEVDEEAILEHIKKNQQRKRVNKPTGYKKQRQDKSKERLDAMIARAGQLFEDHFVKKKLDVSQLSTKDTEQLSRDMPSIPPLSQFSKSLNLYLASKRPNVDLDEFKSYRQDHIRAKANEKKNEVRKKARLS